MKTSEIKPGQLFGVIWRAGPNKGEKNDFRIKHVASRDGKDWPVGGLFGVTVTDVKTNETSVFGFKGEDVPDNWTLIEDVVPSQSNPK